LLHTRLFANGMSYVQIAFDLRGISPDLIDALPLYAGILQKMGAGDEDYVSMAEREAACTGGVWASVRAEGKTHDPHDVQPFLIVGSKAINAKLPQMLQVLADRTLRCDFTDMGRLKDVVLQRRIHLRSDLVPSGTHYASLHAKRHLSRNSALTERFHGLSHVRYVDRVASEFDTQGPAIARKLDAIRAFIQARGRRMASFLGEDRELEITRRWFADLLAAAPPGIPSEEPSEFTPAFSIQEGVCVPTEVAFVAMAFPAVGASSPEAPVLALLGHQLGLDYLFQEVRIKGGAYGAHASFDRYTGAFTFGSYRDPHVRRTLDAYRRFPEYIAHQMDLSPGGIEQAIIGTLKTLDRPVRPSQACGVALGRYIAGETRETRRDFWARLLAVNRDDIRRVVADQMQPAFRHGTICVLAGREKLEAVNQDPSGPPLTLSDL
jgi:Zn-dependent M16 (insulinase) family peptidase